MPASFARCGFAAGAARSPTAQPSDGTALAHDGQSLGRRYAQAGAREAAESIDNP
jgi:hypothetical protein